MSPRRPRQPTATAPAPAPAPPADRVERRRQALLHKFDPMSLAQLEALAKAQGVDVPAIIDRVLLAVEGGRPTLPVDDETVAAVLEVCAGVPRTWPRRR